MGGMIALKFIERRPERVLSGRLGGMGWLKEGGMLQKVWEQMPVRAGSGTPSACVNSLSKLAVSEEALKAIKAPVVVLNRGEGRGQ
jgi:hypothetical protein